MDSLSREIINRYQGDFPLLERPFEILAKELGISESSVINCVNDLLTTNKLSRFGPLYNAACLGGALTLAAVSVPEKDFQKVAMLVNSISEVAHNYKRDHLLNMWFVLATETTAAIQSCIQTIELTTGLKVYNFPKLREYYLGLCISVDDFGRVSTRSFENRELKNGYKLDEIDRNIIHATQAGLPIIAEPYSEIAQRTRSSVELVLSRMQTMLDYGVIRRIGVVPNHYRLGLNSNGMSVWNVSDDLIEELGVKVGQLDYVSHCYQRPRHENVWPYNLFAMVHGQSNDEVLEKVSHISRLLGDSCHKSDVLFSSAILKKSGMRLVS